MAATLTDLGSKQAALKKRTEELTTADKMVDELVRVWAPEEAPPTRGCFPKMRLCPVWSSKRSSRLATNEPSVATEVRQSGDNHRLLNRLVGARKAQTPASDQIEVAMQTVQQRVESLSDRVKIGRERALMARQRGKQEEAIRELKKAKAIEKQLGAAKMALDTLERQQDMIEESTLHRELATALKSTTQGMKSKNKGLLTLAESAIDESVEIRDDVEDVAAVFEGMVPAYDTGIDEEDLIAELEELAGETTVLSISAAASAHEPTPAPSTQGRASDSAVERFPSAPQTPVGSATRSSQQRLERKALLADDGAAASSGM